LKSKKFTEWSSAIAASLRRSARDPKAPAQSLLLAERKATRKHQT
jgi:hypothetical protein